ncbi:MAG: hypothetical protein ACODAB_01200 [Gemmatimonadota bacterium]
MDAMRHRSLRLSNNGRLTLGLLLLAPLLACEQRSPTEAAPASDEATAEAAEIPAGQEMSARTPEKAAVRRGLATLRRATAAYHRVEAAIADGFVQILPCQEHPTEGGLGIPYARLDRFDTTIDLSEPEILFYEPRANGKLRLVAAEPVVPTDLWGDDPPELFGMEFHENEDHGLYGLHMWVWKHNPAGTFAFFNPSVSCEFES